MLQIVCCKDAIDSKFKLAPERIFNFDCIPKPAGTLCWHYFGTGRDWSMGIKGTLSLWCFCALSLWCIGELGNLSCWHSVSASANASVVYTVHWQLAPGVKLSRDFGTKTRRRWPLKRNKENARERKGFI